MSELTPEEVSIEYIHHFQSLHFYVVCNLTRSPQDYEPQLSSRVHNSFILSYWFFFFTLFGV